MTYLKNSDFYNILHTFRPNLYLIVSQLYISFLGCVHILAQLFLTSFKSRAVPNFDQGNSAFHLVSRHFNFWGWERKLIVWVSFRGCQIPVFGLIVQVRLLRPGLVLDMVLNDLGMRLADPATCNNNLDWLQLPQRPWLQMTGGWEAGWEET